jgi:hypothetical protein
MVHLFDKFPITYNCNCVICCVSNDFAFKFIMDYALVLIEYVEAYSILLSEFNPLSFYIITKLFHRIQGKTYCYQD